jgi:prepilin peptidase CpaA
MSLLAFLQIGCLAAFALLLVAAGWQDVRTLRIANHLSIGTVVAFALWAAAGMALGRISAGTLAMAVLGGLVVFAVGAAGFAAGILGGGDVKLLAAASLFAGPAHIIDFLTVTALAGGVLGVAVLSGMPIGPAAAPAGDGTVRARLRRGLPYGPAIAAGGLWVVAGLYASQAMGAMP